MRRVYLAIYQLLMLVPNWFLRVAPDCVLEPWARTVGWLALRS
jgi:hypothetical protein